MKLPDQDPSPIERGNRMVVSKPLLGWRGARMRAKKVACPHERVEPAQEISG